MGDLDIWQRIVGIKETELGREEDWNTDKRI